MPKPALSAPAPASGPDEAARLAKVDPRDEVTPMSPLRKRVAERLVQAQHESASLTTFNEVDMTAVMELRARYKETFEKARTGKLALEDLMGGTFSISNGGIYGSMMSTPLLNYPQTGILGMHNIVKRAVVIDDAVQIRPMMYLALTYDHRVVDGREAVSFLVAVKDRLEAPERLLLAL